MGRFLILIILLAFCNVFSTPKIINVHTASHNILVATVEVGFFDYDTLPHLSGWTVNGSTPHISLTSYPWDEMEMQQGQPSYPLSYPIVTRHDYYLILPSSLVNGTTYNIHSPHGDTSIVFRDSVTFCESIKVNQVGYNSKSTVRYANFGIFLGDSGSRQLDSLRNFHVIDTATKATVYSGKLTYWGADTAISQSSSGEFVYRADLSSVPVGGPYKVVISGIGTSYPFGVGPIYSREIAKTMLRGMYHQRCGIALDTHYTQFSRGQCHGQAAFTKTAWGSNTWINVPTGSTMHDVIGGYHDAGDFDRRPFHTIIPIIMFGFYDAFKSNFIDNQYNIPESGNGIPDFLDESLWGELVWEKLQLDSLNSTDTSKYGGVMMGIETHGHPGYGEVRADADTMTYGTFDIGNKETLDAIGLFAQASRLIRPYDTARASHYLRRAMLSWKYIKKTDTTTYPSSLLYASLHTYLATATGVRAVDSANEYHMRFKRLATTYIVNGGSWPDQYYGGNTSARMQASHFIGYLVTDFNTDSTVKAGCLRELKWDADNGGYMGWKPNLYPYAQGVTKFLGIGNGTTQGKYAESPIFMYRLSTTHADSIKYFDIASQYSDYSMGLNPLGKMFVTGMGSNQLQSPLHLDSWYSKYGKLPGGGTQTKKGNVPGIVIYGANYDRSWPEYQIVVTNRMHPAPELIAGQRRWCDGWSVIDNNEFTTWETNVWNTAMYNALYDASGDISSSSTVSSSSVVSSSTPASSSAPISSSAISSSSERLPLYSLSDEMLPTKYGLSFPPVTTYDYMDSTIYHLKQFNQNYIRFSDDWSYREPTDGDTTFVALDARLHFLKAANVKIFLTLESNAEVWACDTNKMNTQGCVFKDTARFRTFLGYWFNHVKDYVTEVQFGNEWQIGYWYPGSYHEYAMANKVFCEVARTNGFDCILGGFSAAAVRFVTACKGGIWFYLDESNNGKLYTNGSTSPYNLDSLCALPKYVVALSSADSILKDTTIKKLDLHLYGDVQNWDWYIRYFQNTYPKRKWYISEMGIGNPRYLDQNENSRNEKLKTALGTVSKYYIEQVLGFQLFEDKTSTSIYRSYLIDSNLVRPSAYDTWKNWKQYILNSKPPLVETSSSSASSSSNYVATIVDSIPKYCMCKSVTSTGTLIIDSNSFVRGKINTYTLESTHKAMQVYSVYDLTKNIMTKAKIVDITMYVRPHGLGSGTNWLQYLSASLDKTWTRYLSVRQDGTGNSYSYNVPLQNERMGYTEIGNSEIPMDTWSKLQYNININTGVASLTINNILVETAIFSTVGIDGIYHLRFGLHSSGTLQSGYVDNKGITITFTK